MEKETVRTQKQLLAENENQRARLEEAEETLRAIRDGEVDAIVVSGDGDEEIFTLKSALELLATANQSRLALLSMVEDLKRSEEALRESEAELAEAQRIAHVGSWDWVAETDTPTWSKELYAILEVDPDKPAPSMFDQDKIYTPESMQRMRAAAEQTTQTGMPYAIELERVRKDGSSRWLFSRGERWVNQQGQLIGLRGTALDITERKQAEETLHQNETRFRLAIDTLDVAVFGQDTNLRYTWMYQPQLGYTASQVVGKTDAELLPQKDAEIITEIKRRALDSGKRIREEVSVHLPDQTMIFDLAAEPMLDVNGKVTELVGVTLDITERKKAQEKLLENERRFRALVENISDVIMLVDVEGQILYSTPSAQNVLGYSTAELQNRQMSELIHPDDLTTTIGIFKEILSQPGSMTEMVIRVVRKDRGIRWVHISGTNLVAEPSVGAIVAVYHDITKQVDDNQALRESRSFAQGTLDALSAHIAILDTSGQIVAVNRAWREFAIANHPNPQSVCEGANYLTICEAAQGLNSEEAASMAQGLRAIISGAQNDYILEYPCHTPNKQRWFVARTTKFKEQGPIQIVVAHENITERKQAEENLRGNEEWLRQVWEATSDAMALSDANGVMLSANPAYYNLYGYTPEQIIDRNFAVIFPEADQAQALEQYKAVFSGENIPPAFESIVQHADHTEHIVESKISFISNAGRRTAMLSTIRDVTEHKQVEETRRQYMIELERRVEERTHELTYANRAKDEFLANMSHELRTPLNSILGLSETLLEQGRDPLSAYQQRSIQTVVASGRHLLELINDVLDLSKIEAGKFDYYPEVVDVDDLCYGSLAFIREQALRKHISITYKQRATVSKIYADPRRLKQILVNLLINAVKFTPSNGEVTLQVSADTEQDRIQFSIMDTGIGIAAEDLKKLFQPFVQVDSKLTREYEGTGLGLALVQRLTDLHGGSVSVESEVGKGSCFMINLALGQAVLAQQIVIDSGVKVVDQAVHKPTVQSVGLRTILLVEDNMSNILTIGDYLEIKGYQVIVAHDGVEALEQAEMHHPDIILMDIQMPGMDGLEAIRRLRSDPRFASTPIIALTALAMPGGRERCLEAGANEYMSKPVSLKSLVKTIHNLLQQNNE